MTRAVLRLLGLCLLGLALLGTTSASAAGKPRLSPARVAAPPATVEAGSELSVSGAIRNRGKGVFPGGDGVVRIELRRGGSEVERLGNGDLKRVKPKAKRRFRTVVELPAPLTPGAGDQGGPYRLVACIRRGGDSGKLRCRTAKRAVRVTAAPDPPGPSFSPGARTLDDPLFPQIGNGGYDALHYLVDLRYDPATNRFEPGTRTTIRAKATQNLSELSFDFQPDLVVSAVTVDGAPAAFAQVAATPQFSSNPAVTQPGKLVVTPAAGIVTGREFLVEVAYAGTPVPITDADESIEGWVRACQVPQSQLLCDGSFTVNEPIGAQSWYPSNNYAADKATFETRITAPSTHVALGVGELASRVANPGGTTTWSWSEDDPTAPYLTSATVGEFDYDDTTSFLETSTGVSLPVYSAIDSAKLAPAKTEFDTRVGQIPGMTNFISDHYGAYPFDSIGAVADIAPDVNYALENQTKPHFAGVAATSGVGESTLVHEIAHQWMGNSVSAATWEEIWFNEGWATFSEELYADPGDGSGLEAFFDTTYATADSEWETPPAHPGDPAELFARFPVYVRPAAMLEGYRQIVGDAAFYAFAEDLLATYGYDVISIDEFIADAKDASGLSAAGVARLDNYLRQWLLGTTKPTITPDNF